jgi:hypothetical protein
VGGIQKPGIPLTSFGGSAIQTDTLNSYATVNTSAFEVWTDSSYMQNNWHFDSLYSISFWHYYDVDSLTDSCIVQISNDSGATWLDYNAWNLTMLFWDYQISSNLSPISTGKFLWTGQSAGWQKVTICIHSGFPVKPDRTLQQKMGWRFLFKSDTVQTNKPGWLIDKISFKHPIIFTGGSVKDLQMNSLPIYPNPSYDGRFTIDFPSTYVKGQFFVYDYLGRNVKVLPLVEQINLSDLPSGLYSYKAVFNKTHQWFSGKLDIR